MIKSACLFITISFFSLITPAHAWRESNGGIGVIAEATMITAELISDLRQIEVFKKDFVFKNNFLFQLKDDRFAPVQNNFNLIFLVKKDWNELDSRNKKSFLLDRILKFSCRVENCIYDIDAVMALMESFDVIKSQFLNTAFPVDSKIVNSLKSCNQLEFDQAYPLIADSKHMMGNTKKSLDDLIVESGCEDIILKQQILPMHGNLEEKIKFKTYPDLSPIEEYVQIENEIITKMKSIPFLNIYYIEPNKYFRERRLVSMVKKLKLFGQKVDAYTTTKMTTNAIKIDINSWVNLTSKQKYFLVLHETTHYLIEFDLNYSVSIIIMNMLDRYNGLKTLYPAGTKNFIERSIAENLKTCDVEAFRQNFTLLGEASFLFKIDKISIPKAVRSSGCKNIKAVYTQLNRTEII